MARDPRTLLWMEEMALRSRFNFCPDDPEQRAFMLEFIDSEDDE